METSQSLIPLTTRKSAVTHGSVQALWAWLGSRQGLIVTALVLAIPAIVLGWHWLGAAAMIQLLFILPCAGMMLMCMKGMGHGQQDAGKQDQSTAQCSGDVKG